MYPIRDQLDRFGSEEVQGGGVAVRERRHDRGEEIVEVHTS
jgi:hypothetical protein